MQDRDEPITATRLYEKKSRNGNTYFTGRLGGLKVLIFKSRDVADDGSPIWDLKLAQAQPYKERERPDQQAPRPAHEIEPIDEGAAPRSFDDTIPF
jgi:hypothetical protein